MITKLGQVLMDIKRGEPGDPVEGSNITLSCYSQGVDLYFPPKWFHPNSSAYYHPLTFTNKSLEWITEPAIQISEQPNKVLTQDCHHRIY